jgi:hypothetical protein
MLKLWSAVSNVATALTRLAASVNAIADQLDAHAAPLPTDPPARAALSARPVAALAGAGAGDSPGDERAAMPVLAGVGASDARPRLTLDELDTVRILAGLRQADFGSVGESVWVGDQPANAITAEQRRQQPGHEGGGE